MQQPLAAALMIIKLKSFWGGNRCRSSKLVRLCGKNCALLPCLNFLTVKDLKWPAGLCIQILTVDARFPL